MNRKYQLVGATPRRAAVPRPPNDCQSLIIYNGKILGFQDRPKQGRIFQGGNIQGIQLIVPYERQTTASRPGVSPRVQSSMYAVGKLI